MMVSALRKSPNLKEMLCVSMGTHLPCRDSVLCHSHPHIPAPAGAGAIHLELILGLQHPTGVTVGLEDGRGQGQCFSGAML